MDVGVAVAYIVAGLVSSHLIGNYYGQAGLGGLPKFFPRAADEEPRERGTVCAATLYVTCALAARDVDMCAYVCGVVHDHWSARERAQPSRRERGDLAQRRECYVTNRAAFARRAARDGQWRHGCDRQHRPSRHADVPPLLVRLPRRRHVVLGGSQRLLPLGTGERLCVCFS